MAPLFPLPPPRPAKKALYVFSPTLCFVRLPFAKALIIAFAGLTNES